MRNRPFLINLFDGVELSVHDRHQQIEYFDRWVDVGFSIDGILTPAD